MAVLTTQRWWAFVALATTATFILLWLSFPSTLKNRITPVIPTTTVIPTAPVHPKPLVIPKTPVNPKTPVIPTATVISTSTVIPTATVISTSTVIPTATVISTSTVIPTAPVIPKPPVIPKTAVTPKTLNSTMQFLPTNRRLLPFRYWRHRDLNPASYSKPTCMEFPNIRELQYAAISWQWLELDSGSVYVYGAYWDDRFEESLVRILVYSDVVPLPKLYCQLWYPNNNVPQTELANVTYAWRPAWGGPTTGVNEPYILSCRARRHHSKPRLAPVAAAVVTSACGVASNVLDVQNAPFESTEDLNQTDVIPPRNSTSVAVCMKWLQQKEDISVRVVEWFQLVKSFGAEKVYLYITEVHPNITKVLDYYQSTGLAVITEMYYPPGSGTHFPDHMDFVDMRREQLSLNDCLYRNLGRHDWLAVMDVDDMFVPLEDDSWRELIDREVETAASSNSLPMDAILVPSYYVLDFLQKDLKGFFVRSFNNASSVIGMHGYMPLSCKQSCRLHTLEEHSGKLLNYEDECLGPYPECNSYNNIVRDDALEKLRAPVAMEIFEVLWKLGLQ